MTDPEKSAVHGRESLLDTIEALRDQRDTLYSSTVVPQRSIRRALKVLQGEPIGDYSVEDFLNEALSGLEQVSELYSDYTRGEVA